MTDAAAIHGAIPSLARAKPGRAAPAWWMLALVAVMAIAVYANSWFNGFAFDDTSIVKDNPHVTNLEWSTIWTDNYWKKTNGINPDTLYRPFTLWTYLANQYFCQGDPKPFHAVNILLHAAVCVLVAVLTWRILGKPAVALVAGALFAVHPLHTEAVANIVGRAELLAAFWALLALVLFLPQRPLTEESARPEPRGYWHGWLVGACLFVAMLSKETPIAMIAAFPLIDSWRYLQWKRAGYTGSWWRWMGGQTLRYYVPVAVFVGAYLLMRVETVGLMAPWYVIHRVVNPLMDSHITVTERIITPFALFAKYLGLTFWPDRLMADYSAPSLLPFNSFAPMKMTATGLVAQPLPLLGLLVLALTGIVGVRLWKKAPAFLLVVAMFFISYCLVANVIRIGTIFGERLFYLPSAFVLILVAWGGVWVYQKAAKAIEANGPGMIRGVRASVLVRVSLGVLFLGAETAMAIRSGIRNTDWAGDIPLAITTARDNFESAKACSWAGNVLLMSDDPKLRDTGVELLIRSTELADDFVGSRWELAKYYGRQKELAKATIYIAQAARLEPGSMLARMAPREIRIDLKGADPKTYMPELVEYVKKNPDDPSAHFAMALAYHAQGKLAFAQNEAKAAVDKQAARSSEPWNQFHEAVAEYAMIRFDSGNKKDGVAGMIYYQGFVRNSVDANVDLANLLMSLDEKDFPDHLEVAKAYVGQALSVDPDDADAKAARNKLSIALHEAKLAQTLSTSTSATGTASAAPHREAPPGGDEP